MPFTYRRFPVSFLKLPLAYFLGFASLITLLVLSSGRAYAEWVSIGTIDAGGGVTVYMDPDTIARQQELVKMWDLFDYKTIQEQSGDSYLSIKSQEEFDCVGERKRVLALTIFSGHMGSGKVVVSTSDENKWEPVAPKGVGRTLWKVACSKQ